MQQPEINGRFPWEESMCWLLVMFAAGVPNVWIVIVITLDVLVYIFREKQIVQQFELADH